MFKYRHHDTLTYRFPRTTTDAFGLDASGAYAGSRHRRRQYMLIKWLLRAMMVGWVVLMIVEVES